MKKVFALSLIILLVIAELCLGQAKPFHFKLKNTLSTARTDAYVRIDAEKLFSGHAGMISNFSLMDGDKIIPFQIEYTGKRKSVCFVIDINGKESKTITVVPGNKNRTEIFQSRTHAELSVMENGKFDGKRVHGTKYKSVKNIKVPAWHIDHDGLFKYEGPGWESDKVGYRFYLDWRNATDIFGKKVNTMVLNKVGITDTIADNNESFHTMQDWGMDIFKVGSSLGVGSFGMWSGGKVNMVSKTDSTRCEIVMNGPVKSEISTNFYGWLVNSKKYDVESNLSIIAGSRLTRNSINISGKHENIVTGLAKYSGTKFIKGSTKKGWNYIALYGHQSLADDNLGIVVFFKNKDLIELTEDALSYIVKLKPENGKLEYYFGAAWEKELNGIKTEDEFINYLNITVTELNNPLIVE